MKMGFGLWNYKWPEFTLEVLFLFIGIYMYVRSTRATENVGRYGFIVFAVVMLAIQASQFYTPTPRSGSAVATSALFAYILFAGIAAWLERKRVPEPKSALSS